MKYIFSSIFISGTLIFASNFLFASDVSDIDIGYTKGSYLSLIGTAADSVHNFSFDDISNKTVSLGTLGVASNDTGNCTIKFSSVNNYELRHTVSNDLLSSYTVTYKGTNLSSPWWVPTIYTSCNTTPTTVEMTTPALPTNTTGGVYRDIITVIVETQ